MIRTSEAINEISEALVRAQAKFGAAIKASQNPAFRSKYADLSSVIDATLEHLNAEGICAMQHPALEFQEKGEDRIALVTMTTRLQHKSGQWMESDLSIPAVMRDRFDAQSVGSAITYAARYALQSICCVPREDDDGNNASGVGSKDAAQNVAKAKIAAGKAGKDVNTLESPANGQEMPSEEPSQLACYPVGDGWYEITGDSEVMEANKGLLLLYGKRKGREKIVQMESGQLDSFRHEFCEVRGNTLTTLKGSNA